MRFFPVFILSVLLALNYCDAKKKEKSGKKVKYLDGLLVETNTLPLQLECKKSYKYIYLGGITMNGTELATDTYNYAVAECESQLADKKFQAGPKTHCSLTFGIDYSTQDSGIIRALYKCMDTKPSSAPGSSSWEKSTSRNVLNAKAIGKNQFKFNCAGQKDLVELLSMEYNGEPAEQVIVNKKNEVISNECFKQTGEKIAKGSKGNVQCTIQFTKEEAADLSMTYTCVEPPTSGSA